MAKIYLMQLYLCFLTVFVDTRLSAFQARSLHSEYNMLYNVMQKSIIKLISNTLQEKVVVEAKVNINKKESVCWNLKKQQE